MQKCIVKELHYLNVPHDTAADVCRYDFDFFLNLLEWQGFSGML